MSAHCSPLKKKVNLKVDILKLISIFANHIWSIKYSPKEKDVYTLLFNKWQDIVYVNDYFDMNWDLVSKSDIWKNYTKAELISIVRDEAKFMESYFINLFYNVKKGNRPDFDKLFTSLGSEDSQLYKLFKCKAYGSSRKPAILRFYAIQVETNAYVITGGGIKLTKTMNECKHLNKELKHLNKVQKWLKDEGVDSKYDLKDL